MLSRVLVARGISCLSLSTLACQRGFHAVPTRERRQLSHEIKTPVSVAVDSAVSGTQSIDSSIQDALKMTSATEKSDNEKGETSSPSEMNNVKEASPSTSTIDKEFIENLLSTLTVEHHNEDDYSSLVYDMETLMLDPTFVQLYGSLTKSLPQRYFVDEREMSPEENEENETKNELPEVAVNSNETKNGIPVVAVNSDETKNELPEVAVNSDETKNGLPEVTVYSGETENVIPEVAVNSDETGNELTQDEEDDEEEVFNTSDEITKHFIARIQEEQIPGTYKIRDNSEFLSELKEEKANLVQDNEIIRSSESRRKPPKVPFPTWIVKELEELEIKAKEGDDSMKKKEKTTIYDPNKKNAIEEKMDTFGMWPYASPSEPETKKKRGEHSSGSMITKNIIVNKAGVRIAYGGGKRKDASARVYIRKGTGDISINGHTLIDYFPMGNNRDQILAPLAITLAFQKFDIHALVTGGGTTGQSEAIRIALAKAISHYDPLYSVPLSMAGLLTADSREVERKKPGHTKARKPQQWVKR